MKKIKFILIIFFIVLISGFITINAEEIEPEPPTEEITEEPFKNIENIIVALAVSFLGSGTLTMIAWGVLKKLYLAVKNKSEVVYSDGVEIKKLTENIIKLLENDNVKIILQNENIQAAFNDLKSKFEASLIYLEEREKKLAALLETSFGDKDDIQEKTDT